MIKIINLFAALMLPPPPPQLKLSILAKGKLDVYMTSFVSHSLNRHLKLSLFHAHFVFAAKQKKAREYSENYSSRLLLIAKGVDSLKFDKAIYRAYREKIVNFAKPAITPESQVQAMLSELEHTLSDMIIARDS